MSEGRATHSKLEEIEVYEIFARCIDFFILMLNFSKTLFKYFIIQKHRQLIAILILSY